MENNSSRDRLLEVIRISGLGKMEFAEKIGVSPGTISHITSTSDKGRKADMSENVANKIIATFPSLHLRYDWLMRGDGPMTSIESHERIQPTLFDVNLQNTVRPDEHVGDNEKSSNMVENLPAHDPSRASSGIDEIGNDEIEFSKASKTASPPIYDIDFAKSQPIGGDRATSVREQLNDFQIGNKRCAEPQLERIVMFYSDGTFVEYMPRRK